MTWCNKRSAKITWLNEMDINSAYFHSKIKERLHRGRIISIHDADGVLTTDAGSIKNAFIQFYQGLFGTATEHVTPLDAEVVARGVILTNDEVDAMCRPFLCSRCKRSIFLNPK